MFDKRKERELILLIKNETNVKDSYHELYIMHTGFVNKYISKYRHNRDSVDDLKQLAFFALVKAVDAYDISSSKSLLAYYRVWLNHFFYRYNLNEQFSGQVHENDKQRLEYYNDNILRTVLEENMLQICRIDKEVENNIINACIWKEVRATLSDANYYVIWHHFYYNKTLAQIGRELGIGRERARLRKIRSLGKLSNNDYLRKIAFDLYGIT